MIYSRRYWKNRMHCIFHGKAYRRIMITANGLTIYCARHKCYRKWYDTFDTRYPYDDPFPH